MILSRTPMRLSLGGGGTDLPSYYTRFGGFFLAGAIDRYVYVLVNKRFDEGIRVSYSRTEIVDDVSKIEHPIVREALKKTGIERGIEVVSVADAPSSAGLGSSGSFCVGLLRALHAFSRQEYTVLGIAEDACDIAMNKLKEASGKQDEYVASLGGIREYLIDRNGTVTSSPISLSTHILAELETSLLMFYTGITRSASRVLAKQRDSILNKEEALEKMHEIKRIGMESKKALQGGDLKRFGELLHQHWVLKRGVTQEMTTSAIDMWYDKARKLGAVGGKIVGAGGGGYLMLFCDRNREDVRRALSNEGLVEHRFRFDFEGTKIIYNV